MVTRVAVLLCVYLCAVHPVFIKALLTNIKTEAGVLSLLEARKQFYISDLDDNNILTKDDFLRCILMDDLNDDGEISYKEFLSNPDTSTFPYSEFRSWQVHSHGAVSYVGATELFEELPGCGYELDLQEILTISSSRHNETLGPVMKIQSFVHAERDFLIIDENDDNVLSREEFQVEFRIADKNKNGNLEESEVRNMFPMRSTPPENICPNITVSCSVDDVMPLFDSADNNTDCKLNIDEYIKYFGNLIEI